MISSKWFKGTDTEDVLLIRYRVFDDEMKIDKDLIIDEFDKTSFNVVVYDNNIPVGTGRLIFKKGQYEIGKIAILKEYRRKKYGELIVRMLIRKAINIGAEEVYLNTLPISKDFFEKIGFNVIGNPYDYRGIKYITMVRKGDVGGNCG